MTAKNPFNSAIYGYQACKRGGPISAADIHDRIDTPANRTHLIQITFFFHEIARKGILFSRDILTEANYQRKGTREPGRRAWIPIPEPDGEVGGAYAN